jgi:hypothetical protein
MNIIFLYSAAFCLTKESWYVWEADNPLPTSAIREVHFDGGFMTFQGFQKFVWWKSSQLGLRMRLINGIPKIRKIKICHLK